MEILFRAKEKRTKKWIEGFYCKRAETTYCFAEDYEREPVPVHHYIARDEMTDWGLPNELRLYEIDLETLCMYTGHDDQEGNKIWQNDYVEFIDNTSTENGFSERCCTGKVTWDDETASFQVSGRLSAESYEVLDGCTVTGNAYDNPELEGEIM